MNQLHADTHVVSWGLLWARLGSSGSKQQSEDVLNFTVCSKEAHLCRFGGAMKGRGDIHCAAIAVPQSFHRKVDAKVWIRIIQRQVGPVKGGQAVNYTHLCT